MSMSNTEKTVKDIRRNTRRLSLPSSGSSLMRVLPT